MGEVYKNRELREWGKITNTKNSFFKSPKLSKHIQTKELDWAYSTWRAMLLLEVGGCQIKGPMPSLGSEFLVRGVQRK